MRVGASALTALEVAVAGRGAAFAGRENVGIHAQTHRASRFPPLKACLDEDLIESFAFGLGLDRLRTRNHHCVYMRMHMMASHDLSCSAQIFNAGVGAGANEDTVDGDVG